MEEFLIEGGRTLSGVVTPSGNKNEALPNILVSLLTDETIILKNVPKINDVLTLCDILKSIGVEIDWEGEDTLHLNASKANSYSPAPEYCAKIRASMLLLGPLLSRFRKIDLPLPGGDLIGGRRIDTHWNGVVALGGKLELGKNITGTIPKILGAKIYLDEPSVTATENLLMLAVKCEGTTILYNAACEPHVVGLCNLLNAMGAKVSGVGSNQLIIEGVPSLKGATFTIGSDFMEIGSFVCIGAITGGRIEIKNVREDDLRYILLTFARLGIEPKYSGNSLIIEGQGLPRIKKDIGGKIPTIYSGPWPAFPTDLMSAAIVAATQVQGTIIFFEKMFEGRMFFTDRLIQMGANLVLCDPHRVVINGPEKLIGVDMSSPDIRAGMALLTAALVAKGKSRIGNIYQIERGYRNIDKKMESLGAAITRISA